MTDQNVFLCPHGAAKSVIVAAYCQQLADRQNVPLRATAAGTGPDAEFSPTVLELLRGRRAHHPCGAPYRWPRPA